VNPQSALRSKMHFAMHRIDHRFALYLINERRTADRHRLRPSMISQCLLAGKRVGRKVVVLNLDTFAKFITRRFYK
jgi:hypothetical protein